MDMTESAQALIVRNIGDLESAFAFAEKIGEGIWESVQSMLRDRLEPIGWHVSDYDENDASIWFAPREWLVPDLEDPYADPCFTIESFDGPGGEYDQTDLAKFLQAGANGSGIALWFSSEAMTKKRYRQRLIGQDLPELSVLLTSGFEIDSQQWIRIPIRLDVEAVAQGAEDEDYASALKPLQAALNLAVAQVGQFSSLVQSISAAQTA